MPANKPTGPSVRTISSKAVSVPPEGVALVWPALGPTCCLVFSTSSGVVTAAAMQPAVAPERNAPPNDSCLPYWAEGTDHVTLGGSHTKAGGVSPHLRPALHATLEGLIREPVEARERHIPPEGSSETTPQTVQAALDQYGSQPRKQPTGPVGRLDTRAHQLDGGDECACHEPRTATGEQRRPLRGNVQGQRIACGLIGCHVDNGAGNRHDQGWLQPAPQR